MEKKQTKGIFTKILKWINYFFVVCLLLLYIAIYIPPEKAPFLAVLSLLTPVFIFVNASFSAYWLIRRKKNFLLSAFTLLIGSHFLGRTFQLFHFSTSEENPPKFSVMSFNARLFNHYKWNADRNLSQKIISFLEEKKPDILVLQEFYNHKKYQLNYRYKKIIPKKKNDKIGQAFFSNYLIINAGSLDFPNTSNNATFADIVIKNDTIRFYNLHLESLHLSADERQLKAENNEKLLRKIKNRFIIQQKQVEIFNAHRQKSPYKTIVCGDFNNTAFSYTYQKIKGNSLNDAFVKAGKGFGKSFHFEYFPFRIDYILADKNLQVIDYQSFSKNLSDHFPIMAIF